MDFSLNQILEIADDIHRKVFDEENSITISDYINSLHQLHAYVEQIKSITHRVETIHRICLDKMKEHINKTKINEENINKIGTREWGGKIMNDGNIENYYSHPSKYIGTTALIVPGINTNVKIVKNINMIPNTKLYWVSDIQQFSIRINDVLITGNMGNVFTDGSPQNNISNCKNENCKNENCIYLHNSSIDTRNYTNLSWMYTPKAITHKNRKMRHVGNKSSLNYDLEKMIKRDKKNTKEEIDIIINQTMHDLLILMALKNKGLC